MAIKSKNTWHWIAGGIIVLIVIILLASAGVNGLRSSSVGAPYAAFPTEALFDAVDTELSLQRAEYEESGYDYDDEAVEIEQSSFIIYTGSIEMTVESVVESMDALESLTAIHGGYIEYSYVDRSDEYIDGYATIRVDAENFSSAMADIEGLATTVRYSLVSSDDVTEQVVDIQARLSNAQAEEQSYLQVLELATTVEDILNVQRYLSDVRETIERYEAQLSYYESVTSMATISVEMTEETSIILDSDTFRPGQEVVDAVQTAIQLLQSIVVAIIWIVILGVSILIPLWIIFWIGRAIYRRIKK